MASKQRKRPASSIEDENIGKTPKLRNQKFKLPLSNKFGSLSTMQIDDTINEDIIEEKNVDDPASSSKSTTNTSKINKKYPVKPIILNLKNHKFEIVKELI
jgi:hypothetical protein